MELTTIPAAVARAHGAAQLSGQPAGHLARIATAVADGGADFPAPGHVSWASGVVADPPSS